MQKININKCTWSSQRFRYEGGILRSPPWKVPSVTERGSRVIGFLKRLSCSVNSRKTRELSFLWDISIIVISLSAWGIYSVLEETWEETQVEKGIKTFCRTHSNECYYQGVPSGIRNRG